MYKDAVREAEKALSLAEPGERPEALLRSIIAVSKKKSSAGSYVPDFYQSCGPFLPTIDKEEATHYDASTLLSTGTSIVIPVFNSHEETYKCLESVHANTSPHMRVIIIDDFSDEKETAEILQLARSAFDFHVYRNSCNVGFAGSINLGIRLAEGQDVVILNSDTIVSPGWMTGLKLKAYSSKEIGTVTAVSNAAGPFSLANSLCNTIVNIKDVAHIQRLLNNPYSSYHHQNDLSLPTGHGFCMYIKRTMLEVTGELDQQAFPHGYGEENDLCLRASIQGFTHRLDSRTFIYHKNSASFGKRKKSLVRQGRTIIDQRYPSYGKQIASCLEGEEFKDVIKSAEAKINESIAATSHQPPVPFLFVVSTRTGGTPQTNLDLMKELRLHYNIQPYCLYCREDKLEVSTLDNDGEEILSAPVRINERVTLPSHNSDEYMKIFAYILDLLRVRLVHIRHLGWHSTLIPSLCRSAGIPCILSLHDFYIVCPNTKLVDAENNYCEGLCGNGSKDCNVELWNSYPGRLRGEGVNEWRSIMNKMILHCDSIITTSSYTKSIFERIYSGALSSRPFFIIEHGRERHATGPCPALEPSITIPIKILVPGYISEAKGGLILKQLLKDPEIDFIEVHLLGTLHRGLAISPASNLICHGAYRREEFNSKVASIRPDLGLVFSIWPETYCHTLSELWLAGIPVIGSDLGAVGERLRLHGFGWAIPANYKSLKQLLRTLAKDLHQILQIRELLVEENKKSLVSHVRSASSMAMDYFSVYRHLLSDLEGMET
jgi:GT2 family glycosyltransferase/glycosyltransferase involved in cell wall biosynthesis